MDRRPVIPNKPKGRKFKLAKKNQIKEEKDSRIKKRKNQRNLRALILCKLLKLSLLQKTFPDQ